MAYMHIDELPDICSTEQVADYMQLTRRKVERMCQDGDLRAIRAGKYWRITRDSVAEFCGMEADGKR